jgi:hypothetical protein
MPAYSCLLLSRRSHTLWHRAVPIHKVLLLIVRGHSPSAAPVRLICTIASVTLPGFFIRRSTRDRVQLPVPHLLSAPSRPLAATGIAPHFARAWSSPSPRLKASAHVIAIFVRLLQLQYCPQPAKFILIATRTWSPLFARSSFIAWRPTTIRRCMTEFPSDSCGGWYTVTK